MNYKNGKIYAIRSYQTDKYYIGSTIQSLSERLTNHRSEYKKWVDCGFKSTTSCELFQHNDVYIELIENCDCNTKEELHRREGELIRDHMTV